MLLAVFFPFVGHFWITAATEEMLAVTALENVNVSLKCTAQMKPGVDYWAVHWYKERAGPRLTGLVYTALPNGKLRWYVGADNRTSLEYPTLSLLLPPVTCSDCGVYQCFMVAPVGEQNLEGRVRLIVRGCPTVTDPPVFPEREVDMIKERTPRLDTEDLIILIVALPIMVLSMVAQVRFMCLTRKAMKRKMTWEENQTLEKEPRFLNLPGGIDLPVYKIRQ